MHESMKTKSKFWDKTATSVPMISGVIELAIGWDMLLGCPAIYWQSENDTN